MGHGVGRERHRLTAAGVKAAREGTLHDGGGLMLHKAEAGSGRWVWRYQLGGRRRDMGLGSWPTVPLAQARRVRDEWAEVLAAGRDPVAERDARRAAARLEAQRDDPTLREAAERTLEALAPTLKEGGERGRWMSPLAVHVLPKLGARRVSSLTERDVEDVLRPLWQAKPETAKKVRQRLRLILTRGRLSGWPCDPLVVDRAALRLGEVHHVGTPIAATPWQDVPALYARLSRPLVSHAALRLALLTVVRLDAVRGIRATEIAGDVWTVPVARVKGRVGKVEAFRVPLPPPALALVAELAETATGDLLLTGPRGGAVSDRAMELALDDLGEAGRPHGFRTAFRTWAQDTRLVPWDVAETALGHRFAGKVERSYARSDLLEQRREAMALWSEHVLRPGPWLPP